MKLHSGRNPEQGSAMLVTVIVIAALLAGGAVLVSMQLAANRSTDLTRTGISAMYCAEAGLAATRTAIAQQQATWDDDLLKASVPGTAAGAGITCVIGTDCEPSYLASINHDIDTNPPDGIKDWEVMLQDNFDETTPPDKPGVDADKKIWIVSRCLKYPDTPREVRELIDYSSLTNCYNGQRGGCGGNGNMN